MKRYTPEELAEIIRLHGLWRMNDPTGCRANLCDADLRGVDLRGADLRGADLRDADLCGVDLRGADLCGVDLRGAKNSELALVRVSHIPAEGGFMAWKQCMNNTLVRLWIPEDAQRSHAGGRKCRATHAQVIEVIGAEFGVSCHDRKTTYRKGETVVCDKWCEDRWQECAGGIHFFLHRLEAEEFVF